MTLRQWARRATDVRLLKTTMVTLPDGTDQDHRDAWSSLVDAAMAELRRRHIEP
jgi:hypothetical protein